MKRVVPVLVCVLLFSLSAAAQATPNKLAFVSASVKPSALPPLITPMQEIAEIKAGKIPTRPKIGPHVDAVQAEYDSMSLKDLLMLAYKVRDFQFNGPGWMDDKLFDIVAKMPNGASIDDAPMMLQSLLEDRFKLVVHRASKEKQVMGLMVDKGGPKLNPVSSQPTSGKVQLGPHDISTSTADGPLLILNDGHGGSIIKSDGMTMAGLANLLSNLLGEGTGSNWKVVVDQTGLQGAYQVTFNTSFPTPLALMRASDPIATYRQRGTISNDMLENLDAIYQLSNPESTASSNSFVPLDPVIFQSVQQKLGLKLEVSRAPIEMLVVDHAEKNPTAN